MGTTFTYVRGSANGSPTGTGKEKSGRELYQRKLQKVPRVFPGQMMLAGVGYTAGKNLCAMTTMKPTFQQIPLANSPDFLVGKLLAFNGPYNHWSIEHYNRCSFRCSYCATDSQGLASPMLPREQLLTQLEAELNLAEANHQHALHRDDMLGISRQTDPYTPEEASLLLTREIITRLIQRGQRFTLATKGALVLRDIDLLKGYRDRCQVRISIACADDETSRELDPHADPVSKRFHAIEQLHAAGIPVMIAVSPWIPDITDVEAILSQRPKDVFVEMYPLDLGSFMNERFFLSGLVQEDRVGSKASAETLFDRMHGITRQGLCNSAKSKFSKKWSQQEIHRNYIAERNRVGFVKKTAWCYPQGWNGLDTIKNQRYLAPNEIEIA